MGAETDSSKENIEKQEVVLQTGFVFAKYKTHKENPEDIFRSFLYELKINYLNKILPRGIPTITSISTMITKFAKPHKYAYFLCIQS